MKFSRKYWFLLPAFLFLLSLPVQVTAQTPKGKSLTAKQKKDASRKKNTKPRNAGLFGKNTRGRTTKGKVPKEVKAAEKKKKQQKKAYERARKQEIKRRYKMQTPETQKRMKQTRREADAFNSGGKQNFWQRMFGGGNKKKKDRKKQKDKKK